MCKRKGRERMCGLDGQKGDNVRWRRRGKKGRKGKAYEEMLLSSVEMDKNDKTNFCAPLKRT
jgi:hypothetical protein